MTWGEWVETIIWIPLTLQMSLKYPPRDCCHTTWSEISGSSIITRDPGDAWKSRT